MLLFSDEYLARARARSQVPEFAAAMRRLREAVAEVRQRPVVVPPVTAGYYHDYFCPEHSVQLEWRHDRPCEHRCPLDGALHKGARQDRAWYWFLNTELSQAGYRLGLLWQLEADAAAADKAAEILLAYAARYPEYAPDLDQPRPGRACFHTLDESVWLLPLTWAFDAVRERMAPADARVVRERLLAQAAGHLIAFHQRSVHNFACWHNAAICTAGRVLGREAWVEEALRGPYGFERQMAEGVLGDGLWYEGSLSYHYYTLGALLWMARALLDTPWDIRPTPKLQAMLAAPIRLAYPDLTLPATNDCWYAIGLLGEVGHGIPPSTAFYELAWSWYRAPEFAGILTRAYQAGERETLEALLYGEETIEAAGSAGGTMRSASPVGQAVSLPSVGGGSTRRQANSLPHFSAPSLFPDSGYVVLRDAEDACYLLLKYGPHGGGHGHPDKLNVLNFGHGRRYSPDLGTPGYGIELNQSWYRATLSHNTVQIDGRSQPPATGTLIRCDYDTEGEFVIAAAEVKWAEGDYAGVSMRRTIVWRGFYWIDIFDVTCDRPRLVEWLYHNAGDGDTPLQIANCALQTANWEELGAPSRLGWAHVVDLRRGILEGDGALRWAVDSGGLSLWLRGEPGTEIVTGRGPFNPSSETLPMVAVRRSAARTTFAAVFHPHAGAPVVERVGWSEGTKHGLGSVVQVEVVVGGRGERWAIDGTRGHAQRL